MKSIYNVDSWLESGGGFCHIFTIVGVTVHSLHPDWMHAKHLGTDKVLCGSVMYLLVYFVLSGTPEENLMTVWLDVLYIYKRDGVSNKFAQMKTSMFNTKSSPKLKGKAAEGKDMVPVLHKVWLKYFNPALEVHRNIEIVLRTGAHMDKLVEQNRHLFALPPREAADLIATGFAHLGTFWKLRQHFAEEDYPLFQLTSKGHYLMHMCLLSSSINPALAWAYTGEDFMGKCRDLALSCAKGSNMWAVSNKMSNKWLIAMHLTWSEPSLWFKYEHLE